MVNISGISTNSIENTIDGRKEVNRKTIIDIDGRYILKSFAHFNITVHSPSKPMELKGHSTSRTSVAHMKALYESMFE
jgi:hypothetical protein